MARYKEIKDRERAGQIILVASLTAVILLGIVLSR